MQKNGTLLRVANERDSDNGFNLFFNLLFSKKKYRL